MFAKDGTVTAGNASPPTDGAAAVLLTSEETALLGICAAGGLGAAAVLEQV